MWILHSFQTCFGIAPARYRFQICRPSAGDIPYQVFLNLQDHFAALSHVLCLTTHVVSLPQFAVNVFKHFYLSRLPPFFQYNQSTLKIQKPVTQICPRHEPPHSNFRALIGGVMVIIFVNILVFYHFQKSSTDRPLHEYTIYTVKFQNPDDIRWFFWCSYLSENICFTVQIKNFSTDPLDLRFLIGWYFRYTILLDDT